MLTISTDLLKYTDEAVLLIRRGRILFANEAAKSILGSNCVDRTVASVLGKSIAATQTLSFSAMCAVKGKNYLFRSSAAGDIQALFFSSVDDSGVVMITDAMLCSLRSNLMTMNISLQSAREKAAALNDSALEDSIASMTEQGYKMSRLISNASFAKCIAEGSVPFAPAVHDAAQICSDIADSVSILRRDIEVTYSGPEHLYVSCDRMLTELMLLNLLSNSLTHAEGVTRIRISLDVSGETVYYTVSDNGCGMDGDALRTVFSRFKQVKTLSGVSNGAGLGMTVVRGAAAAHGGTVLLESSRERGTIVRVSFVAAIIRESISSHDIQPQGMETILTGLAGCIPTDCYSRKYFD